MSQTLTPGDFPGGASPIRRSLLLGVAAVPVAGLLGCSGEKRPTPAPGPSTAASAANVIRVGSESIPETLKLTPQTVIVKDAARGFKGVESDGQTLRLDAAVAGNLQPGNVALLADVAVVKVRSVQRNGSDVLISAEPCAITELIADGVIEFSDVRIDTRAGRVQVASHRPAAAPLLALLDLLVPPARAESVNRLKKKVGNFDVDAGYVPEGDHVAFDGKLHGRYHGVTIDIDVDGNVSGFELGGRIAVANGRADNLNMLVKNIAGELSVQARGGRDAKDEHQGDQMLDLPIEYSWPIVIDGIPFLLKLKMALLVNEGFTNLDATAGIGAKLRFNGTTGFDMRLPGEPDTQPPKVELEDQVQAEFSTTLMDGIGLGPQALIVACQFPRVGFGLGLASAYAGSFIDVVTAANTTIAGATAPVPCKRGQVVITGSVGVEAKFLKMSRSLKYQVYQKETVRAEPDVKACRIGATADGGKA